MFDVKRFGGTAFAFATAKSSAMLMMMVENQE
jgi:hypothetical protein